MNNRVQTAAAIETFSNCLSTSQIHIRGRAQHMPKTYNFLHNLPLLLAWIEASSGSILTGMNSVFEAFMKSPAANSKFWS